MQQLCNIMLSKLSPAADSSGEIKFSLQYRHYNEFISADDNYCTYIKLYLRISL